MLKKLIVENWKSFRYAELYIDPLTVLIGTNASGKSNLVEALEFLRRMANGETVDVALNGDRSLPSIRGGSHEVILKSNEPKNSFTLKIIVENEQHEEFLYTIETEALRRQISEELMEWDYVDGIPKNRIYLTLFRLDLSDKMLITQESRMMLSGRDIIDGIMIHDLIFVSPELVPELSQKIELARSLPFKRKFFERLQSIFIINPIPDKMRNFSKLSEQFEQDASNIAGVLVALPDQQKSEVESTLSHYLEHFPEGDIKKVWAEKVGRLGTDAMLYCQEEWQPGQITEIDARSMSDGTLRLLGILTALLTRPEGSLIVIEEIDNGLHPSRAELLVKILREIGTKRKIDLLITTHNPALLDALGPEIIPFITVVHRDAETGESKLTLLEDIENLPKLLATGSLGKLATKGIIEKTLAKSI
jgi:predicted ATPase